MLREKATFGREYYQELTNINNFYFSELGTVAN